METTVETTVAAIPESITLNGVTYSTKETPELLAFIQQVSKVEKTKLYTQFEGLKKQINDLQNIKIEPVQTPLAATQYDRMKSELVQELTTSMKDAVREVVQPVLAATRNAELDELSTYREKLVRENDATCIPDLVKGNSKQELEASLAESIRLRGAYPSPSAPAVGHVTDPLITRQLADQNQQATPATMPVIARIPSPEVTAEAKTKTMSMDEFATKRESLQAELTSLYGGGQS